MKASILAMTAALMVVSCAKEEVVPTTTTSQTVADNKADGDEYVEVFFLLNGTDEEVEMSAIEWTDETHFLFDYEGQNLAFDSDDHFLTWASEDESREEFLVRYDYYKSQQEFAIDNGYMDDEEATERYTQELIDAEGGEGDRLTISILFNNTSYGGSYVPVFTTYPTLFSFKNKAESILFPFPNIGALCDRTWYRGAKFWYFAVPTGGIPNLFGFNNRADSIF